MAKPDPTPGRLRPGPSVHTRLFDGELVILDLARGEYLSLDPVGSRLWSGLVGGRSVKDVASEVVAEYDATLEQVVGDLEALASEFVARGLLVEDGAAS